MANGSIWGHGAYLGPDYAAAVLDQIGVDTSAAIASGQFGKPLGAQLAKKIDGGRMRAMANRSPHRLGKRNRVPVCDHRSADVSDDALGSAWQTK
jgi:nitric oxide reductase large subunit